MFSPEKGVRWTHARCLLEEVCSTEGRDLKKRFSVAAANSNKINQVSAKIIQSVHEEKLSVPKCEKSPARAAQKTRGALLNGFGLGFFKASRSPMGCSRLPCPSVGLSTCLLSVRNRTASPSA